MTAARPTLIHPTAIIEPGAQLDTGVQVGAYSIIGPHVRIGRESIVHPHVVVTGHTAIGEKNEIFQFASVGAAPQDLKYKGEPTELIIGDGNVIREYATLQPGTANSTGKTIVGSKNLFMASSHVAHDCRVGDGNVFANSVALAGHVTIMNRVILGGLAAIHQFCRIGDLSFVGGGSMVGKDVPPFAMVQGYPARLIGINSIGLKRAGFGDLEIRAVRDFYKSVLMQFGSMETRLASLDAELREAPISKQLIEFCRSAERGVMAPRQTSSDDEDFS